MAASDMASMDEPKPPIDLALSSTPTAAASNAIIMEARATLPVATPFHTSPSSLISHDLPRFGYQHATTTVSTCLYVAIAVFREDRSEQACLNVALNAHDIHAHANKRKTKARMTKRHARARLAQRTNERTYPAPYARPSSVTHTLNLSHSHRPLFVAAHQSNFSTRSLTLHMRLISQSESTTGCAPPQ